MDRPSTTSSRSFTSGRASSATGTLTVWPASTTLPPQQIRATAKFYEELTHDRPAERVVKVCNGEACRVAGFVSCEEQLLEACGLDAPGGVGANGVRVEHVTCLGYCGLGPNVMLDNEPVSMAGEGALESVLEYARSGAPHGLNEPNNPIHMPPGRRALHPAPAVRPGRGVPPGRPRCRSLQFPGEGSRVHESPTGDRRDQVQRASGDGEEPVFRRASSWKRCHGPPRPTAASSWWSIATRGTPDPTSTRN